MGYEDTVRGHTPNQRESAQAANLYAILQRDSTAKILVHAGYGHIQENVETKEWIPMAAYLKNMYGIDPLTIDQTHMTEGSITSFEAGVYNSWIQKQPVGLPVVPLLGEIPADPFDMKAFDIFVIHPPTKYINGRANWTSMNGLKKEFPVQPAYRSLFMVQAYYAKEYNEKYLAKLVPADQTYLPAERDGYYHLYLRKGKYKLIFRDKSYKILGSSDIESD
jgi:hypothetical protein